MKRTTLLLGSLLFLASCSDNREKVVQSQRGDTEINEGEVPVQAPDATDEETDADYMQEQDLGGNPGITNDTTGSTTVGAPNDQTGTPPNAPPGPTPSAQPPK